MTLNMESIFSRRISITTLVALHLKGTNWTCFTQVGRGVFLGGQPCFHPKGAGLQRSTILGFALFMPIHFDAEGPSSTWWGGGLLLGVSHAPVPRSGTPSVLQFGGFSILCPHPLTQNDQIWRGNIWEGTCC